MIQHFQDHLGTFFHWKPSLVRASTRLEMSRGVTGKGRVICSVGVRGNYYRRMVKQMWGSRLEEGAGSLLQSAAAAAVGSVSQSLCSGGICAAPVGSLPLCLFAQSLHSMCHRKCRPRSGRIMRKHSCRPSHLPYLNCLPHFKGFLSWLSAWTSRELGPTWPRPRPHVNLTRNPNPKRGARPGSENNTISFKRNN